MKLLVGISFILINLYSFGQGTGLKMDVEKYKQLPLVKKELGYGSSLPSKIDLKKYAPSVKSQGEFGTCVGWASTYYLASMEYAILNDLTDQYEIDKNTFDPYYTYLKITSDDDYFLCDAGCSIEDACVHLYRNGVKRFGYNELTCGSHISNRNERENSMIRFTDYHRLIGEENTDEENITAIKQALTDKHPVLIGMVLTDAIYDVSEDGLYSTEDSYYSVGGHAMTIVGFNDNLHGGCFEIINSWGDDWGNDGYLYMKYDEFLEYTPFAYAMETELRDTEANVGCVFGDCENGYGRYVYSSGDIYEGDFVNSNRNGYGIYFWPDQSHHQGEWEGHERHGKGQYVELSEVVRDGYWENGSYNYDGNITNTYTKADRIETVLNRQLFSATTNEIFSMVQNKGFRDSISELEKSDCVFGDCENGLGVYFDGEGENRYVKIGFFINEKINGYSEVYWVGKYEGHEYKGGMIEGNRSGFGAYTYPNGNKYLGEWKENQQHGVGSLFKRSGEIKAGEWVDGEYEDDGLGFGGNVEEGPMPMNDNKNLKQEVTKEKSTVIK